ncbi:MAG: conjugal transfer protein TrbF [Azoarcus sp.]|jgi:type IV secretion system protein VirB5|nr:conjugal transfer protein TrbF [Azoarcus sp.]
MHPILQQLFKKKQPVAAIPLGDKNPFLNARRKWNEHVGDVLAAKQTWQIIGLFSLCIALAAVGGIIHIGQQNKFVPYVVETDTIGQYRAAGILQATTALDPRIIRSTVSKFIHQARVVTPDMALQRKAVLDVYGHLHPNDPAQPKMSEFYREDGVTNPFKRSANEMVDIDIKSVLQQTKDTWQAEWQETVRDRKGVPAAAPIAMRALVTVKVVPPTSSTTEAQMQKNPFGIFVEDFSWTRLN